MRREGVGVARNCIRSHLDLLVSIAFAIPDYDRARH
jgi:hypothetical protein